MAEKCLWRPEEFALAKEAGLEIECPDPPPLVETIIGTYNAYTTRLLTNVPPSLTVAARLVCRGRARQQAMDSFAFRAAEQDTASSRGASWYTMARLSAVAGVYETMINYYNGTNLLDLACGVLSESIATAPMVRSEEPGGTCLVCEASTEREDIFLYGHPDHQVTLCSMCFRGVVVSLNQMARH